MAEQDPRRANPLTDPGKLEGFGFHIDIPYPHFDFAPPPHNDVPLPHIDIAVPHIDIPPPHGDVIRVHGDLPIFHSDTPPPHADAFPHIDIAARHIDIPPPSHADIIRTHSDLPIVHSDVPRAHFDIAHLHADRAPLHADLPAPAAGDVVTGTVSTALNQFGASMAQRDASFRAAMSLVTGELAKHSALGEHTSQTVRQVAKGVGESVAYVASAFATLGVQLQKRIDELESRVAELENQLKSARQ